MSSPTVAPPNGGRPSDQRRKQLGEELSVPTVSNFFPIERYYEAADKVYSSFQDAFASSPKFLDEAYVYGKRYCLFCIDAIPTHNYYRAEKYKRLASKHNKQVEQVLKQLEMVAAKMDEEEKERQRIAAEKAREKAEEMARLEAVKYKDLQIRADRVLGRNGEKPPLQQSQTNLEASAMSKLKLLGASSLKQEEIGTGRVRGQNTHGDQLTIKRDPSGEEPSGVPSSRYRLMSDSEDDDEEKKTNQVLPLPPSVPVPGGNTLGGAAPPPPSYHQALATKRDGRYSQSSLSPSDGILPQSNSVSTEAMKAKHRGRIPIRKLQEEYRKAYVQLTARGKIKALPVSTYQGRVSQSTNGCTVISALVASRHLSGGDRCITDSTLVDVIDRQCGPLLREIRTKLGLGGHALIIPSDVHDHLVDRKLLNQKFFEGAAGGNVMDEKHMGEFLKLLSVGEDGKGSRRKAAATFFFREHVISIVKTPTSSGTTYDLVDSLPSMNLNGQSRATRTRCDDIESLAVLLRWYTSRKFSDTNCSYIDRNDWDDNMADIDPRVFQGFVWHAKVE